MSRVVCMIVSMISACMRESKRRMKCETIQESFISTLDNRETYYSVVPSKKNEKLEQDRPASNLLQLPARSLVSSNLEIIDYQQSSLSSAAIPYEIACKITQIVRQKRHHRRVEREAERKIVLHVISYRSLNDISHSKLNMPLFSAITI